jgi:8-oxo-dGTP pyrophosphatase MutT (NUDIX family)
VPVPDFVLSLRAKVGHDLLWLPCVTAVVLRENEVLLVLRSDNGAWTPVTGIVDPGEHPADAATREVMEETGVRCLVDELVWVHVGTPTVHANGDRAQYLDHTFRCLFVSGDPYPADDESVEARWFALDDLPELTPNHRERIMTALHHRGPTRLR